MTAQPLKLKGGEGGKWFKIVGTRYGALAGGKNGGVGVAMTAPQQSTRSGPIQRAGTTVARQMFRAQGLRKKKKLGGATVLNQEGVLAAMQKMELGQRGV